MTKITRGNPANLKNVRSGIYCHYIRVDNPTTLIFLSGQLSRDADGNLVERLIPPLVLGAHAGKLFEDALALLCKKPEINAFISHWRFPSSAAQHRAL